jgi:hypothetical protein
MDLVVVHTGGVQQVVHVTAPPTPQEVERQGRAAADLLRPYRGRYVARLHGRVIASAETPVEVAAQLRERHLDGAAIFRVPLDPNVDPGGAAA